MRGGNFNLIETCNQKIQSDLSCSYKGLEKLLMSLCLNISPFFFFFFFPMKISSTLLPHQRCSVILGRGGGGGDLARSHARTRATHFLNYLKEIAKWDLPKKRRKGPPKQVANTERAILPTALYCKAVASLHSPHKAQGWQVSHFDFIQSDPFLHPMH